MAKINKKYGRCVVHGEFVETKKPVLEDLVKEFDQKYLAVKGGAGPVFYGPKYAEGLPTPLSEILDLGDNYRAKSFEDSIKNSNFNDCDKLISEGKKKKEELKKVSKDFGLTKTDIMAIFTYTFEKEGRKGNSPYNVVNRALAERNKETLLLIREYILYLLMGLRKLPKFDGEKVLYRGVAIPADVAKNIYREGSTLTWTSFSSTSSDENKAYSFAGENGVIFEIHGKFRGYSIGTFSNYLEEGKLMFLSDYFFD